MAIVLLFLSSLLVVNAANTTKFTPEAMLSAPRRGTALPNSEGTLALYTLSTHSFQTHKNAHGLYVMDLSNGSSWLFSNSSAIGEATWLGDGNTILWTVSEDDGTMSLLVGDATEPDAKYVPPQNYWIHLASYPYDIQLYGTRLTLLGQPLQA